MAKIKLAGAGAVAVLDDGGQPVLLKRQDGTGVRVTDINAEVIGAFGVSGDTSAVDEDCAAAGIAAADLKPM